ncbi:MAG TPA: NADH-quinone oxidoreductase subunit L [Candidatus Angelobacter sp.]|nr:NADH-quinone oxidoreductase subunit L [Candidatus Angelobacter sp.]
MNQPNLNLWVIPLLPLIGAAINGLFGRRFKNAVVSTVALLFTAASFAWAVYAVWTLWPGGDKPYIETVATWITAGSFSAPFGFYLDQLSMIMVLVVTGVGFLIHVYSVGYMAHEGGFYRFFTYLNLFMFFMLTLVLANNYLLMFVGWEGVGLASYLLIGFFFQKKSAADAGKKAFIVNRIGDFGFLIGMFLIILHFGTLNYDGVFGKIASGHYTPELGWGLFTAIGLCLLFGATGKSAQVPLYVWLPDAMEGPTPVSALIHAATMVTAGIYMIARSHAIFNLAPHALEIVAIIGCLTAIFAATMGITQTDIKRVLAYSTISQLGYMVLACGVAAYAAGIFHLMTHAFFKALLFLGAGSVIHAIGGEQDMRRMGGLRKKIPITFWVMTAATFAIAGFPPFAGFFSKDEILGATFHSRFGGPVLWTIGVITAGLTSFYMFRLWFMTFFGEYKPGAVDEGEEAHAASAPAHAAHTAASHSHGHADDETHGHGPVHESPWIMLAPLVILAVLSVVGGWVGIPQFMGSSNHFEHFLAPVMESGPTTSGQATVPVTENDTISTHAGPPSEENAGQEWLLASTSVAAAVIGLFFAWLLYYKRRDLPGRITAKIHGIYLLVLHKYYIDEGYGAIFVKPLLALSTVVFWRGVDQGIIDGLVNGAGSMSKGIGNELRRMQSGNIRSYAAWVAVGGAAVVAIMIWLGVGR